VPLVVRPAACRAVVPVLPGQTPTAPVIEACRTAWAVPDVVGAALVRPVAARAGPPVPSGWTAARVRPVPYRTVRPVPDVSAALGWGPVPRLARVPVPEAMPPAT
jgi:hypothetical protein